MYQRFDSALSQALNSEYTLYGSSERSIAIATARRAAAENHVKAMNEATLGKTGFAVIHDTASTRYHEDAEAMLSGRPPHHHPVSYYLKTADKFSQADDTRKIVATQDTEAAPAIPLARRKRVCAA